MRSITLYNYKKIALAFLMLLVAQISFAQEDSTVKIKRVYKNPVTGIITDAATGKPLVGINVSVTDYSASITDEKGAFTISVPDYNADVMVSGDGYAAKQVSLNGSKTLNVALLDNGVHTFQDPITMPLSIKPLRNVTQAASQYKGYGEWTKPFETIDALLQGQVSGLNSIRRSGTPGVGANMFLRGYNSLYATNKPLVIVDGMLFDANDYGESLIANNYTNPLALINVQDIDNVTVLKDAASIYGTKGANGAIIITTSRASKQATKIDFGVFTGFNKTPDNLPVMDAANYRVYLSEILQSQGLTTTQIAALPYMNDNKASGVYYRYHNNTDWQKKVFDAGINNNYFLKVTGGDNIATYGLSVGFMKNQGIIQNTDLTKYNTRFNADFNFTKKFTGAANLSYTYNEQNLKDQGIADKTSPLFLALVKAPFLTDREVNEIGVFSPNLEDSDTFHVSNPAVLVSNMLAASKFYRFQGSFKFKYDISRSFSASTLFGVVYDKVRENIFIPRKGVANDTLSNDIADSRLGTQVKRLFSVFTDSKIEFNKVYNSVHSVSSRLGLRYQHNDAEQDFALGFNSATDELISVQNGLNALRQVGGGTGEWNWMNTYFNTDYGYRNKFFLSLNVAVDGSSRFGAAGKSGIALSSVRYAVMPSLSAAWLLSSEQFMAGSAINLLKLRLSYSITGNDDIGNYTARQTYSAQNLLGLNGLVRSGIPNAAIQWETNKKFNAGVDLAFWNERANISLDVYQTKTTNMLVYEDLAAATGFGQVPTNDGSMKNNGVDLSANFRVVNNKNWTWDVGANLGKYTNEIVSVPGGAFETKYAGATILTKNGQPANQFYGYEANGVFSTSAEATAAGLKKKNADGSFSNFGAGDIRFSDLNGDKIIDENDRKVIGDPNPDLFGGLTTRVGYKRFQLNALFTFSQGNDVYNYVRYRLESASSTDNQLNSVVNRWRAEGQQTSVPKASFGDPMGNSRFSNRWIEDGSYLRLRTLSVGYDIPMSDKGVIKNISVYVAGNNLLTFTRYMGYDPEFSASPSVFAQGIDTGLQPQFKSATLGVRFGL